MSLRLAQRIIAVDILAVLLPVLLAGGCAKQKGSLSHGDPAAVEDTLRSFTKLSANVVKISIEDDRANVTPQDRRLHMPEWTIVGHEDQINPELRDLERGHIRREVERYFSPGSTTVTVDVFVLNGTQTFTVGERLETITAAFAVRIEVANHADIHDVRTGVGEVSLKEESLDITTEQVSVTYARAISATIRLAFEQIASKNTHP